MKTRPILVTGAGGQLGHDLVRLGGDGVVGVTRADLDIADSDAVKATLDRVQPSVVINAAAWTAVDACESDIDRANLVNGQAVAHVVEAADAIGADVIQISTDYVFNGGKDGEWVETDAPDPQSAYGRSKLLGEHAASDHTVVRTSWVCGANGGNMVKTILRLGAGDGDLRFVDDQRGKPSFTADLAAKLLELAAGHPETQQVPKGIFHLTNERVVSWFGFTQEVMGAAGYDVGRVHPVATADLQPPRPAPRPANSALANTALPAVGFGPVLRDFAEPLKELVHLLTGTGGASAASDTV